MRRGLCAVLVALLLFATLTMATGFGRRIPASRVEAAGPTDLCSSISDIGQEECEALLAVYTSAAGPQWIQSSGWLTTPAPCSWHGVTCTDGHVSALQLAHNKLEGSLPAELGSLTHLEYLSLGCNALKGAIPPEVGTLQNLRMLLLYDNELSGPIPPELGSLTSLTHLRLHSNQLSGSIPPELGNLTNLTDLVLKGNQLSGSIPPELAALTNLRVLYLNQNQLSDDVPAAMAALAELHPYAVDLGHNMLTASDPEVKAVLDAKDPDWALTQTVPPTHMRVTSLSSGSVSLAWKPIAYSSGGGYYEVGYASAPGGPYTVLGATTDKCQSVFVVDRPASCPSCYFVARAHTPAHGTPGTYDYQQNNLWSHYTGELPAGALVTLPLVSRTSPWVAGGWDSEGSIAK